MVHASLRRIGLIEGGADALIDALFDVVGADGTLFAYADFELTEDVPFFDSTRSPCAADHGVFPEVLRRRAGTRRSLNPGASVVAAGARAEALTEPHPDHQGYGVGSPFERFVAFHGVVLLLGSDWDRVTLLHHAEALARLPDKRICRYEVAVIDETGAKQIRTIEEFDTSRPVLDAMPDDLFERLVRAFVAEHAPRTGLVGSAQSVLLDGALLLADARVRMERDYG